MQNLTNISQDGDGVVTIGKLATVLVGVSTTNGIKLSASRTAAMSIHGEDNGVAIASSSFVRAFNARMRIHVSGQSEAEFAGVNGQLVINGGATLDHNDAAVRGSYEITTTAATLTGTLNDNVHAALYGRIGITITATSLSATGRLAGVAAMSTITDGYLTIASGGIFSAFLAGRHGSAQVWEWGVYLQSCKQGIYADPSFGAITTGEKYGINIQQTVDAMTGGTGAVVPATSRMPSVAPAQTAARRTTFPIASKSSSGRRARRGWGVWP